MINVNRPITREGLEDEINVPIALSAFRDNTREEVALAIINKLKVVNSLVPMELLGKWGNVLAILLLVFW